MTNRALSKNKKDRLPLFLCFAIPFAVACVSYIILGLYPFGPGQLLAHDEWHQYYPFFASFREKLLTGGSLQYTWDFGMGTGYASLFAYYLASPLYLLAVLVPEAWLREYFAFMTVIKIACAGLFFGIFLKITFRKVDFVLPAFAMMYAFCAWAGGYAWNIIWLDVFALLPLLIAGTVSLLREGRFRLYVIALALSLWCNYYIAYFCCLFVLICFIGYCIIRWQGFHNFCCRFVRIGLCTLLAFGLAAVLLLPTLLAMQTTNSAAGKDFNLLSLRMISGATGTVGEGGLWELLKTQTFPGVFKASRIILMNLLTGTQVNKFDDSFPNLFCSFSGVLLATYGIFNKKISLREKIFNILLLIFFNLSFIFRILDYIWHGFHFPNMLYCRFSFLFSFVLIAAAYRSYTQLRHSSKWALFGVVPVGALLLANYLFTADSRSTIVILCSAAVLASTTAVLLLYGKKTVLRRIALVGFCVIVSCEMILCWGLAVRKTGYSTRSIYPKEGEYVGALLDYVEENEDELFWRTEVTYIQTLNDSALNDYHGVSIFTSSANVNFNRFSRSLGLSSWPGSNRYSYYESTPLSNTLCGIKYLIDRDGQHFNTRYNHLVASSGGVKLLENSAYISLGFMAHSDLADFVSLETTKNPIADQNEIFRLATGQEDALYHTVSHSSLEAPEHGSLSAGGSRFNYSSKAMEEDGEFRIRYIATADGLYCASSSNATGAKEVKVYCNGELRITRNIKARSLFSLGDVQAGDELEFVYKIEKDKKSSLELDVAYMDSEVFDRGMETLKDEPWVLTEFSDTHVEGTVEAKADGLFYTSIPYEPGWTAYVDGEAVSLAEGYDPKEKDVALTDAVISFPLSAGTHTIELRYTAPGFIPGLVISLVSLLLFAALCIFLRKKPILISDAYALKEYDFIPEEEEDNWCAWAQEETLEDSSEEDTDGPDMEDLDLDALLASLLPEEDATEESGLAAEPSREDFSFTEDITGEAPASDVPASETPAIKFPASENPASNTTAEE